MPDDSDIAADEKVAGVALRDEDGGLRADFVLQVTEALEKQDSDALKQLAGALHSADMGDLLEAIDPELRPQLVARLGANFDYTALTEVEDAIREEILDELGADQVAEGVRDLESDDAVYILEDLSKAEQAEILAHFPPPERIALERSLYYPENSAGRRMQTDFIAVPPQWTVGQTIDYMRETEELPERFYELYVIDPLKRFVAPSHSTGCCEPNDRFRSPN